MVRAPIDLSQRTRFLNRLAEAGYFRGLIVSPDLATPWCLEVCRPGGGGDAGGGRVENWQLISSHDFAGGGEWDAALSQKHVSIPASGQPARSCS